MRVVVHDYSGHPFQVELSRELARRGHTVHHWFCESYQSGKGALARTPADPTTLSISSLSMGSTFQRYLPWKRVRQEIRYGLELGRRLVRIRPDVAMLCNTPLLAHGVVAAYCGRAGIPMVFWQQDIYSEAIAVAARRRLGAVAGWPVAQLADRLEAWVARSSAAVIAISEKFRPTLTRWRVEEVVTVIPNWAPLGGLRPGPRDNLWAREHDLVRRPVVMYAGTLGLKHNPSLLLGLAEAMSSRLPEGRVVVVSEGRGRDWLERRKTANSQLLLLGFQPFKRLPEVLASADVLVALLDPSAGRYSVPSKVLSYLGAGRPVVAVLPADNDASAQVHGSGGGVVMDPGDDDRAISAILGLLDNPVRQQQMAAAGRAYAEHAFGIHRIADRFEAILQAAAMPA